MSGSREIRYALDFRASGKGRNKNPALSSARRLADNEAADAIPRIARLMALAIR